MWMVRSTFQFFCATAGKAVTRIKKNTFLIFMVLVNSFQENCCQIRSLLFPRKRLSFGPDLDLGFLRAPAMLFLNSLAAQDDLVKHY